jgi:hypothetical protein
MLVAILKKFHFSPLQLMHAEGCQLPRNGKVPEFKESYLKLKMILHQIDKGEAI